MNCVLFGLLYFPCDSWLTSFRFPWTVNLVYYLREFSNCSPRIHMSRSTSVYIHLPLMIRNWFLMIDIHVGLLLSEMSYFLKRLHAFLSPATHRHILRERISYGWYKRGSKCRYFCRSYSVHGQLRTMYRCRPGARTVADPGFELRGVHFLGFRVAPPDLPSLEQFPINHRQCLIKVIFRVRKVGFWPFPHFVKFLKNCLITFFSFYAHGLHASELLSVGIWLNDSKGLFKGQNCALFSSPGQRPVQLLAWYYKGQRGQCFQMSDNIFSFFFLQPIEDDIVQLSKDEFIVSLERAFLNLERSGVTHFHIILYIM